MVTRRWPFAVRALFCGGLSAILLVAGCGHWFAPLADRTELRIDENIVTYKGIRLMLGAKLGEWKRAFGEPSRYIDRAGGIYVWDDLGLAISLRLPFPHSDPHVAALRIFFAPRDVDFWPRSVYQGAVTFVQPSDPPGGRPVVATLNATTTLIDLATQQHVSTRYGYPNLSPYTVVRFAARPLDNAPIELCSVQIDPTVVRLPWESTAAAIPDTPGGR